MSKSKDIKIYYGQKMFRRKNDQVAYIVTEDPENDYLIKMSKVFPYKAGGDEKPFFVHVETLKRQWRNETEGVQSAIKF